MDFYKRMIKRNYEKIYCFFVILFAVLLCGGLWYQRYHTASLSETVTRILMNGELHSKLVQQGEVFPAQEEPGGSSENEGDIDVAEASSSEFYYAQLAGFGELRSAEKYSESLRTRGIQAFVKAYTYRTPRRKRLSKWYQVVTDKMLHEELVTLLDTLAQTDRLTGSVICKCDE